MESHMVQSTSLAHPPRRALPAANQEAGLLIEAFPAFCRSLFVPPPVSPPPEVELGTRSLQPPVV